MNVIKNTLILLRFPFSIYLLPVFLFAISQSPDLHTLKALLVFVILHFLIYPASNGFNSYMDQDTDSIGGLENPPPSTPLLLYTSLALDVLAIVLSLWLVHLTFALMAVGYILASRAYSSRSIRLKKYPIISFLIVFVFQGGFTFVMVLVGSTSLGLIEIFDSRLVFAAVISSMMIGGGYPLTQIYQHQSDADNGDRTLSMMLDYRGTFLFSITLFGFAGIGLFLYFWEQQHIGHFILFQLFSTPLLVWFGIWMRKVWKNNSEANFKNTMRMNNISAICMNLFYGTLLVINQIGI
jgi:1,4-dihydroxy-2-naphthoate octaprenyltransferase